MESARATDPRFGGASARPAGHLIAAALTAGVSLAVWAGLAATGWAWGNALNARGVDMLLEAPPFYGAWDLRLGVEVALPVAVAAAIVLLAPAATRSLGWRPLLVATWAAALGWAVALALTDGPGGINLPLEGPSQYLSSVPLVASPGELLSTFTDRIGEYATHVRSHPPGMLLGLWALDRIGLGGSWPAAVVVLAVAASAMPAALVALRALAGEPAARAAAPFLVLLPGAVWIATTADALFMGVAAWAVALVVVAITAAGRRSDLAALAGGILFGVTLMLSYGLALLAAIPLAAGVGRRRLRPLALAAAGVAAVMLAFLAAGFWWVDGFFAVREQYLASIARNRPYDYFLVNNLAVLALMIGPVAALALARLRDRGAWLLVGGAAAAVLIADVSGMSKAEVERIWLPFVPWIMLAAVALPRAPAVARTLLGAQAALAIAIQVGLRTPW